MNLIILLSIFIVAKSNCAIIKNVLNPTQYLPTVMWHGMGDNCCSPYSMNRIKSLIEDTLPGIYVYSIMIGPNVMADTENSIFGNSNDQVKDVCETLSKDERFKNGFNALGISQGSQLIRAVAQRCNIRVHNLVTFGGQHQGAFGLPRCQTDSEVCEYIREALYRAAYEKVFQEHIVQAQYWHDPLNEDLYRNSSIFLADINNENGINEDYKQRIQNLDNFVLVKFLQDTIVVPIETEWFGFYKPGQDKEVMPLQQTDLYKQDRLGLRSLDEAGKLHFLSVDADHIHITADWFVNKIVIPYFSTKSNLDLA